MEPGKFDTQSFVMATKATEGLNKGRVTEWGGMCGCGQHGIINHKDDGSLCQEQTAVATVIGKFGEEQLSQLIADNPEAVQRCVDDGEEPVVHAAISILKATALPRQSSSLESLLGMLGGISGASVTVVDGRTGRVLSGSRPGQRDPLEELLGSGLNRLVADTPDTETPEDMTFEQFLRDVMELTEEEINEYKAVDPSKFE